MDSASKKGKHRYENSICNPEMNFEECEMAILRHQIDESEERNKSNAMVKNPKIKSILKILEDFISRKKLVCYGGLAINNILPKSAQFYDFTREIPDYDMFSSNAMEDAIELADLYHKAGYDNIEAKTAVHAGTFKVYVQFIPIADITQLPTDLFKRLQSQAKTVANIRYCPPNFLRMNLYLELSRPLGDVSRWEKVYKRLVLLNKHYPLSAATNCQKEEFQQIPEGVVEKELTADIMGRMYNIVLDALMDENVVFFGGYANSLYAKFMPKEPRMNIGEILDFDVLSEDPERVCTIIKERLQEESTKTEEIDVKKIKITKHAGIPEMIPDHYRIQYDKMTIAHIYEPIACHSYNEIKSDDGAHTIRVGTIDTLLTFYMAFIYTNRKDYDTNRIMCMAKYLFDVQQKNRLKQSGLLKRFSINCIGNQPTLEDIRIEKANRFNELKNQKGTREYNMWFLKYNPAEKDEPVGTTGDAPKKKSTATKKRSAATKKAEKTKKKRSVKRSTSTKSPDDWFM
jgi:Poly(A) polymerase catalytic subunit